MAGSAYYRGFLLEADTQNVIKNVQIASDDGLTHPFTGGPSSEHIRHNGQSQIEYAFTTPFVAHLIRHEAMDAITWQFYGLRPVADPWPELSSEVSPWLDVRAGGGASFLQGLIVPLDTSGGTPSLSLIDDMGASHALQPTASAVTAIKAPTAFWLATPVITHAAQLVPSVPCRIWYDEIAWVADALPELASVWTTEPTTHGMSGYQHIRDGWIALISTATVTLTITIDGTAYTYPLTSTSGAYAKLYFVAQTAKGLSFTYSLTSNAPFRLFRKDCEIHVRAWGASGPYATVNPFGDESAVTGARI